MAVYPSLTIMIDSMTETAMTFHTLVVPRLINDCMYVCMSQASNRARLGTIKLKTT